MATITYESMESIVPNAIMRKGFLDGVFKNYRIKPADGYVLHDSGYDTIVTDDEGNETGEIILGYRASEGSVGYNYDFTPIQMLDEAGNTVTAYGSRQFFCKLESDVPVDQIFGVTNPDHEIA